MPTKKKRPRRAAPPPPPPPEPPPPEPVRRGPYCGVVAAGPIAAARQAAGLTQAEAAARMATRTGRPWSQTEWCRFESARHHASLAVYQAAATALGCELADLIA